MSRDLRTWIKQVRAAQRRAELFAGTFGQNRAKTIPNKKCKANRELARKKVTEWE